MNQLDLWGGLQQTKRGFKYLINNTDKILLSLTPLYFIILNTLHLKIIILNKKLYNFFIFFYIM